MIEITFTFLINILYKKQEVIMTEMSLRLYTPPPMPD